MKQAFLAGILIAASSFVVPVVAATPPLYAFDPVDTTFIGAGELLATDMQGRVIDCKGTTYELNTDANGKGTVVKFATPTSCRLQFSSTVKAPLRIYDGSDAKTSKLAYFIDGRSCATSSVVQAAFFYGIMFASKPIGGNCGFSVSMTVSPAITIGPAQ